MIPVLELFMECLPTKLYYTVFERTLINWSSCFKVMYYKYTITSKTVTYILNSEESQQYMANETLQNLHILNSFDVKFCQSIYIQKLLPNLEFMCKCVQSIIEHVLRNLMFAIASSFFT